MSIRNEQMNSRRGLLRFSLPCPKLIIAALVLVNVILLQPTAQAVPYVHDVAVLPIPIDHYRPLPPLKEERTMALGDPDFMIRFASLMAELEGFRYYAYDDYSGKAWHTSDKVGDPTVGIGFNLMRPDAADLLRAIDAPSIRCLLKGCEKLTRDQALRLVMLVNGDSIEWLRKHFDGVKLTDYQWVTLASLAYNSRWNRRGPTLVGPKLTKAIKEQDWSAADYEIRENSAGGVPANLKRGILKRRAREADIFAGVEDVE